MFQSPGSVAFSIGSFDIRWYGILIALGIIAAYTFSVLEAKRRSLDSDSLSDAAFWVIIGGVLGARLYYVVFQWEYYSQHLTEIFSIWHGGLAIHGALIGGVIAFLITMRIKKCSWLKYADVAIPGVLFAQAVGRWGNFFNNEAFGKPTDLPWGLFIPESFRPLGFEEFSTFHPTFLYESVWNLLIFVLLVLLAKHWFRPAQPEKAPPGSILFLYLIFYSLGRFFVEGLRLDSLYLGGFRVAQMVSIALIVIGILFFVRARLRARQ